MVATAMLPAMAAYQWKRQLLTVLTAQHLQKLHALAQLCRYTLLCTPQAYPTYGIIKEKVPCITHLVRYQGRGPTLWLGTGEAAGHVQGALQRPAGPR